MGQALRRVVGMALTLGLIVGSAPPAIAANGQETLADVADRLVDCFDVDGENYCTHLGFIDLEKGSAEWDEMWAAAELEVPSGTGDMPLRSFIYYLDSLPAAELAAVEALELEKAYGAVGKVKLYDYVGFDQPIPAGFFDEYPELGIAEGSPAALALRKAAATGEPLDLTGLYEATEADIAEDVAQGLPAAAVGGNSTQSVPGAPSSRYLIYSAYREQTKSYYCGPATFQAIDGGDDGGFESQDYWAGQLGTTTDGTAISSIVSAINSYTAWDNLAGTYAEISTVGKTSSWYFDVHQINIGLDGAILVEHVRLEKQFYPYLAYNASGHFQTGRGYSLSSGNIAIFEPYDERDWKTGGNYTGKHQYVHYTNIFNANQDYANHGQSWHVDIGA